MKHGAERGRRNANKSPNNHLPCTVAASDGEYQITNGDECFLDEQELSLAAGLRRYIVEKRDFSHTGKEDHF